MMKPGECRTFGDFADNVLVPYVLSFLKNVERVDVVFDKYLIDSLKQCTRQKSETG